MCLYEVKGSMNLDETAVNTMSQFRCLNTRIKETEADRWTYNLTVFRNAIFRNGPTFASLSKVETQVTRFTGRRF